MLVVALLSLLAACGDSDSDLDGTAQVRDVTMDEPVNDTSAAVRLTIDNTGAPADRLVGATTSVGEASLHESTTNDEGHAVMVALDAVDIPEDDEITFEPGGLHVMVEDLDRELEVGDTVPLTLEFENSGDIDVTAEVVPTSVLDDDHADMGH